MSQASYCDECKHYTQHRIDETRTPCGLGHRPRFYMPQTIAASYSRYWGWKRRCQDFKPTNPSKA